jgi:hypothetical protein
MAEDKGWFARQASRTAEDIKYLPDWLRTQRDENTKNERQSSAVQEPKIDPQRKTSA